MRTRVVMAVGTLLLLAAGAAASGARAVRATAEAGDLDVARQVTARYHRLEQAIAD